MPSSAFPNQPDRSAPPWLKIGLVLAFVLVVARFGWLADDAFITFRTVQNFVGGYGLTWNIDERVQAYTHPLWLFLIAALYTLTHEIFLTAILASVAISGLAVAIVLKRSNDRLFQPLAFVAMLLLSQAVRDFSTSGLENPLSFLLVAIFWGAWLRASDRTEDRDTVFPLFLLGGLLALNRLDLALLVFPALALTLIRLWSLRTLAVATFGLLPLMLWEVFSLIYYGFPFPNTYYAKLHTGIAHSEYLRQGWVYLLDSLQHDPGTPLLIAVAIVSSVLAPVRHRLLPFAIGLLLYLGYVVSVGGDFMQGRFLAVPAFLAAIMVVEAIAENDDRCRWLAMAVPMMMALPALAGSLTRPDSDAARIRSSGIADERRFYFDNTALLKYRRDLASLTGHPFYRGGLAMRAAAEHERLYAIGVIGMVGYAAGPQIHIVDTNALSDPLLARLPCLSPWRIGHFQRVIPHEYIESLRSGSNQFRNEGLAHLYDDLQRITRGPLLDGARWKAIWELNTRMPVIDLDRDRPPLHVQLDRLADAKPDGYWWDATGTIQMDVGGIDIALDGIQHAAVVSTSLDHNDNYAFQFMNTGRLVGNITTPERPSGNGLWVHRLEVPQPAIEAGYDHIIVLPRNGDGRYAIGHLLLSGG